MKQEMSDVKVPEWIIDLGRELRTRDAGITADYDDGYSAGYAAALARVASYLHRREMAPEEAGDD